MYLSTLYKTLMPPSTKRQDYCATPVSKGPSDRRHVERQAPQRRLGRCEIFI